MQGYPLLWVLVELLVASLPPFEGRDSLLKSLNILFLPLSPPCVCDLIIYMRKKSQFPSSIFRCWLTLSQYYLSKWWKKCLYFIMLTVMAHSFVFWIRTLGYPMLVWSILSLNDNLLQQEAVWLKIEGPSRATCAVFWWSSNGTKLSKLSV